MKLTKLDKKFMLMMGIIGIICGVMAIICKLIGAPQFPTTAFFFLTGVCGGLMILPVITNWLED